MQKNRHIFITCRKKSKKPTYSSNMSNKYRYFDISKKVTLMKNEAIKEYIIELFHNKNEFLVDRVLFEKYEKIIKDSEPYEEMNYIQESVIGDIKRHYLNKSKDNFNIDKIDLSSMIDYINSNDFPFYKYLEEAVKYTHSFVGGENYSRILDTQSLIKSLVTNLHILNLVRKDELENLARKRDSNKVLTAIDTLIKYSNDEQVKYYLETIEVRETAITEKTVLSCIFCDEFKILEEMFSEETKSNIVKMTNNIMIHVFSSSKDYRPYPNIEVIEYKGYKLRKFKEKP